MDRGVHLRDRLPAEVAVFASAAPEDPVAAGVAVSSLGGEQATTVAAAKPTMARAPARRVKEWVIVTSGSWAAVPGAS